MLYKINILSFHFAKSNHTGPTSMFPSSSGMTNISTRINSMLILGSGARRGGLGLGGVSSSLHVFPASIHLGPRWVTLQVQPFGGGHIGASCLLPFPLVIFACRWMERRAALPSLCCWLGSGCERGAFQKRGGGMMMTSEGRGPLASGAWKHCRLYYHSAVQFLLFAHALYCSALCINLPTKC